MLGADRVWSQLGATGAGIVVGSSDSGVDGGHPALAEGFRGGDDSWYDPWNGTPAHRPTTAGTARTRSARRSAAAASASPRERQWVGCVNLYRNLGNPAHYLDCLQFMLAPFPPGGDPFTDGRPERAPHVLTNSWGCPPIEGCDAGALRPATAALAAAGIFVVVAAGNTGPFCGSVDDPPAPYPDVLTVGAVDRDREVASFSSRGPVDGGAVKPDLVAPGVDVLSAMPDGGYDEHERHLDGHPARGRRGGADVVGEPGADRRPGAHPGHPARHGTAGPAHLPVPEGTRPVRAGRQHHRSRSGGRVRRGPGRSRRPLKGAANDHAPH